MKKLLSLFLLLLLLTGCSVQQPLRYQQISQQDAKNLMDAYPDYVVLDVREQHEYDAGHIPGAVLLPLGSITKDSAAAVIPTSTCPVMIYCRSGNRSKQAAEILCDLGYLNVKEFGGINTWPYEIE